tara:strand:+ start:121 stop:1515 length:1395 start_codon:yes stop_codon:yes gene_type:complete
MAYTVEQDSGTGVQGVADDIFYLVRDDTNYADPKYRYLVRLTINSVVIGTFKQLPNSANCAVFRIQDIISDYVQQDETILRLGLHDSDDALNYTKIFGLNKKAIETVSVEFGYEKAATVNDTPVQTFLPALNTTLKAINGSLRSLIVNSNAANSAGYYELINGSARFLSVLSPDENGEMPQWVLEDQFGALAFLNGDDVGSDDSKFFHVSFFDAAGGALNTNSFENNPTNGGVVPAAGLSDEASILYFGAFPLNLEFQSIAVDLRPSNNSGWDYYEVQAASSATLSGNEASLVYRFNKLCSTRYNQSAANIPSEYFLSWWNEVGGIDNLVCDGASNVSQSIQRNSFRSMGGNAFKASATVPYSKGSQEGGMTSVGNLTTTSITLNTRENNPTNLNSLIMSLVNSPRVYVCTDSLQQLGLPSIVTKNWIRCIVKGAQIGYKTALNDKISNYTIEIEISRRKPNVQ